MDNATKEKIADRIYDSVHWGVPLSAADGPTRCAYLAMADVVIQIAEAELVKRMMEDLLNRGERYAARQLEKAVSNICVSDSDIDAAPPRAGSAIAPTRDEGE